MMRSALVVMFMVAGCMHSAPPRNDVYVHPSQYVLRTVTVCGHIVDSANIVESADSEDRTRRGGLSIAEKARLILFIADTLV
jgi:hypothetical protein